MKKYLFGFILTACMPLSMQAQVEIDDVNFPDANFRNYVATFDADGDGELSEVEIAAVTKIEINTVADFTGIENFTNLTVLYSRNNSALKSIDLSENVKLKDVRINNNAIESIDVSMLSELQNLYIFNNKLTALDVSANLKLTDLQCNNNNISSLTLPDEQREPKDNKLKTLICSSNPNIKAIDVTYFPALTSLQVTNCGLDELDVTNNKNLTRLYCEQNNLTTLDVSNNSALTGFRCSYNKLTEIDVKNLTKVTNFECRNNELTVLDVSTLTALTNFNCNSNHLTSIDLSNNPLSTKAEVGVQNIEVDVTAIDFKGFGLEILSIDPSTLNVDQFSAFEGPGTNVDEKDLVDVDGKKYLVLGQPTDDVDLWDTDLVYVYTASYANGTETAPMKVRIKAYPFVMYVNPKSKDKHDGFYAGTLIVDYDAVVPEGTEAYVATAITALEEDMRKDGTLVASEQLNLEKIADAGEVVPANTAIYVKAADNAGLYVFARNLEEVEPVTVPEGNILQGTLRKKTVAPKSVLTLGRENQEGTGEVGFWCFQGTTIPAHRAYVEASWLKNSEASGLLVNFDDSTDGINAAAADTTVDGAWYTIEGIRLQSAPTTKGIFINNGKKVVLK